MNIHLIDSLGWTLLHFLWQGALVGAAVALLLSAMRTATPQQRYLTACLGLLACLLWPAAELAGRLDLAEIGAGAAAAPLPLARPVAALLPGAHLHWLVGAWLAGALALALRLGAGLLWLRRAGQAARSDPRWERMAAQMAARFGIERRIRVGVLDDLASPITAGWLRPMILLPAALVSGMPPELLNALLAHELAHIRRLDYLVNLAQNLVETLLFYHPAVWWLSRRIRAERELVADALAAEAMGEGRTLASALADLARRQSGPQPALAANGGDLLGRVRALVGPRRRASGWSAALPVLALAVAGLSMAAHAGSGGPVLPLNVAAAVDLDTCAKPDWPAMASPQEAATVKLRFTVAADGSVADAEVIGSSGHRLLDQAALEAIGKCSFRPALHKGKPVRSQLRMEYVWKLQ